MDRRSFLAAAAGAGTALAGCARAPADAPPTESKTPASGIVEYGFRPGATGDWFPLADRDEAEQFRHAAAVRVESPMRIVVLGQLPSGSRSCKETVLHDIASESGTLSIAVSDDHVAARGEDCTAELALIAYETSVTFAREVPDAVRVAHLEDGHERTFVETIAVPEATHATNESPALDSTS